MIKAVACFACILMMATVAESEEMITITGEQWPPYNSYVLNPQEPGTMFAILSAILEESDYGYHYAEKAWARAIVDTRSGLFDALIGPGIDDAPDLVFPAEEIAYCRIAFYVRRDSDWRFTGIESLEKVNVGVLKGMTYGKLMDGYVKRHKHDKKRISMMSGQDYLARNFAKLKMGRIDATLDDGLVISHFLKRTNQTDQFTNAGEVGKGYGVHIAFSPKYPHAQKMADMVTAGVRQLRQTGRIERILAKYGAQDWK